MSHIRPLRNNQTTITREIPPRIMCPFPKNRRLSRKEVIEGKSQNKNSKTQSLTKDRNRLQRQGMAFERDQDLRDKIPRGSLLEDQLRLQRRMTKVVLSLCSLVPSSNLIGKSANLKGVQAKKVTSSRGSRRDNSSILIL